MGTAEKGEDDSFTAKRLSKRRSGPMANGKRGPTSSKLQVPSSRELHDPKSSARSPFANWEILWSLEFGCWSFPLGMAHSVSGHLKLRVAEYDELIRKLVPAYPAMRPVQLELLALGLPNAGSTATTGQSGLVLD